MAKYRVIIDQSTSGTKALLVAVDNEITLVDRIDLAHCQLYPQKGWVEHDPLEIIKNVKLSLQTLLKKNKVTPSDISSLSLTNQRESIVVWDQVTGKLHTNVMVWKCNRGLEICESLKSEGYEELVKGKTGLTLDPYFSAPKLKWYFDQKKLTTEELKNVRIGTIDTWVIWSLTEGQKYVTDISNASRTMLFDIREQQWDKDLCQLFNVPQANLPEVINSVADYGSYLGIPILSVLADSQSALYGNMCVKPGEAKATLGTGSSLLMNIGNEVKTIGENILTTIAWKENNQTTYALEGVIRSFGDILNWQKDGLNLFATFQEGSDLAFSIENNGGVYLVPALEGLGAPFWQPNLDASFVGMTRNTTKKQLIRAGFESMAFQLRAVIDEFEKNDGLQLKELHVDGGSSKNSEFMQLISDITKKTIVCGQVEEVSAMGTLAILGETIDSLKIRYKSYMPNRTYEIEYQEWRKILKNTVEVSKNESD